MVSCLDQDHTQLFCLVRLQTINYWVLRQVHNSNWLHSQNCSRLPNSMLQGLLDLETSFSVIYCQSSGSLVEALPWSTKIVPKLTSWSCWFLPFNLGSWTHGSRSPVTLYLKLRVWEEHDQASWCMTVMKCSSSWSAFNTINRMCSLFVWKLLSLYSWSQQSSLSFCFATKCDGFTPLDSFLTQLFKTIFLSQIINHW